MRAFLSLLLFFLFATFATAQETSPPDYTRWDSTAARAESVIDADRASTPAFETLRAELVEWRTRFQQASGTNAARVETLQAQIDALGPVPEEGQEEPAEIAEERAELEARLAEIRAPARRAEAELQLVTGLISEIDSTLAERQTGALLTRESAPLNPANWPDAWDEVGTYLAALATEFGYIMQSSLYHASVQENLPAVLVALVIGLVLLTRGWHWVRRFKAGPMAREHEQPSARVSLFLLSLLQHLLPLIGIGFLVAALFISGFTGVRGTQLLDAIDPVISWGFAGHWLGRLTFPLRDSAAQPLVLTPEQRRRGRFAATGLGLIIGLRSALDEIAAAEAISRADLIVLHFPLILLAGLLLARLGRFLVLHARVRNAEEGATPIKVRLTWFVGRVIIFLGFAGPLVAGVGYVALGNSFLFPAINTLALMGLITALQRFLSDLYAWLMRRRDGLETSLAPTLLGFALWLASLPVFALIWGVREAQLADFWRQAIQGFDVGGVVVSPRAFLLFVLVFGAGYTATRFIQASLRGSVLPKTRLDAGGRNAVLTGTGYVGIFLSALFAITAAGIDLSSIAIVAGALSVGIGFGLQAIVSNFVSGIILLIERPIKEGDWVEIGTTMGYVREISVRSTRIETFDRSDVIVPNADLISGVVTNYTHQNNMGRVIVPVGAAYGSDTRQIEEILLGVAKSHPMVLAHPAPAVVFTGFGLNSLDFEIRAILRDVNWVLSVKSDMNHEIAKRFTEAGIEIPFSQTDLWLRNPEVLGGRSGNEA